MILLLVVLGLGSDYLNLLYKLLRVGTNAIRLWTTVTLR